MSETLDYEEFTLTTNHSKEGEEALEIALVYGIPIDLVYDDDLSGPILKIVRYYGGKIASSVFYFGPDGVKKYLMKRSHETKEGYN